MKPTNDLQLAMKSTTLGKPWGRILLLGGLLLLAALLFSFLRYQPALRAAPGYNVHNTGH